MREVEISYSVLETFRQIIKVPDHAGDAEIDELVRQAAQAEGATDGIHSTSYALVLDEWQEV